MFRIAVAAEEFKGVPLVKQHRRVNEVLAQEISDMHGLTLHTMTPEKWMAE